MKVNDLSPEYELWMKISELPRTMMNGTRGMKLAGETFLPKFPAETDASYRIRLENSILFNVYLKTALYLTGQVFQSPIQFDDNVDQLFFDQMKTCDTKGNDVNVFAKRVFLNGLAKGVSHILVDAPTVPKEYRGKTLSIQQQQELGLRPYLREIEPEAVIGWRVNPDGSLDHVRILEIVPEPVGDFETNKVTKIRVYYSTGDWEVYRVDDNDKSAEIEDFGSFGVPGIPLYSFIPGEELSPLTGVTPINDLADLNLAHWRSYSDQVNFLHVARQAILFGKNIEVSTMVISAATMLQSNDRDADLKFVEITGKSIEAGERDVKELEARMAIYGLQQLVPRTGSITATEKALTSKETNSSLGTWATDFDSMLCAVFSRVEEMQNREFPEDGCKTNKEYNFGIISNDEAVTLLKLNEQGILSAQATFDEFKRRGLVTTELTWEENKDQKDSEAMEGTNEFSNMFLPTGTTETTTEGTEA